ncbi:MAG: hypothetical protein ACNS64_14155 [Candidatus Halalkalibacterium sp. M3_1C_030]
MNTFKECLAEDYSEAVKKSFDILLGKLNHEGGSDSSASCEAFPTFVEGTDSKRLMDTFRTA